MVAVESEQVEEVHGVDVAELLDGVIGLTGEELGDVEDDLGVVVVLEPP